ncbi:hypothetical protein J6590_005159 [Homalodisca vitripennis]|nr:hypothetical protein J6590_005159 [Homalodisca vitripennis]
MERDLQLGTVRRLFARTITVYGKVQRLATWYRASSVRPYDNCLRKGAETCKLVPFVVCSPVR